MVNVSNYNDLIKELIPTNTQLVAVSKFKPIADIATLYEAGQYDFGENYVQEMLEKYEALPKDIKWHFIGHLQTNKVKYVVPFVHLIHSVDSFKLLQEVHKQASKCNRVVDVLLQVYLGQEDTKYGMDATTCLELLSAWEAQRDQLQHVRIVGMMGMASFVEDMQQVRKEFSDIYQLFQVMKQQFFFGTESFNILSMGMSGDYSIAIEEGSNMIRVGSTIFGHRG